MSTDATVKFLREYNRWRRGDERIKQPEPKEIGEAIDAACDRLECLEAAVESCYQKILTEPDVKAALFAVEDLLRAAKRPAKCRKCGGAMLAGVALADILSGSPDFSGGDVCTVSPSGAAKMIDVSKCQACGHSVNL